MLNNKKSFEVQKIIKTNLYIPFINQIHQIYETLIYLISIIFGMKQLYQIDIIKSSQKQMNVKLYNKKAIKLLIIY
ncbi:unnamed protein product [Paramecium pentaurelia]|uniref:Uncharacterized protein n=1 Tax=Paramecium pentaurelia TaxID=43138 RepID=A0A8S1WXY6_9CILI|nr:unnamed protein product [Paramecium pentaurelia]